MPPQSRPQTKTAGRRLEGIIRGLFALCIALIVFGIAIRFVHLDRKFYTNDEATASLHVAGHTIAEYAATVFDGRPRTVAALLAFQRPDATTTNADVVRSLAREDPQHPPLFYVADRAWTAFAGNGVAARRSLSAVFGALAIAAIAWLAFELFGSALVALAGAALVAVSPFHVLYAQQTREYALWTLLVASASALFLVALRRGATIAWAGYAALVTLGLYADVLFLETVVAHAIFVSIAGRTSRTVAAYAVATLVALAAFAPWLVALWHGSQTGTLTNNTFLGAALPVQVFALKWFFNAGAVFFDLDYRWHALAVLLVPLLGFAFVAALRLVRTTPVRVWSFVASSSAVAALTLLVPDIAHHTSRSTSARYLVPLWLGLELAVAWYLVRLVTLRGRARATGVAALLGFACAGVASCALASDARVWWGDASVASLVPIAAAIAAVPNASVAYRATWTLAGGAGERWDFAVVQLADVLPESVRFEQFPIDAKPASVVAGDPTFVLDPTNEFVHALAHTRPLLSVTPLRSAAAGIDAVGSLQRAAQRLRSASGVVDFEASLWEQARK